MQADQPPLLTSADERAISAIETYLRGPESTDRSWVFDGNRLEQRVCVSVEGWRSASSVRDLDGEVAEGVAVALDAIERSGGVVDRELLTGLSRAADATPVGRVAAWFATMCWGAGPRNRSRLRQWTRALSTSLAADLEVSSTRLLDGDFLGAYRHARMPGVGEAYLTKWLWALGLPEERPLRFRPQVLDSRVWSTLGLLGWAPDGPSAAARWVHFCTAVESWAAALNRENAGWAVDADRVEQLLFDRDVKDGAGVSLNTWLRGATTR